MYYKNTADKLLVWSVICFIGAALLRAVYPGNVWTELCYFVTEASLIGGIADWFAVTALFRKPWGFGWHTAIVPRNRQKIIDNLADMVETEFLSGEDLVAEKQLDKFSAVMSKQLANFVVSDSFLEIIKEKIPLMIRTTAIDVSNDKYNELLKKNFHAEISTENVDWGLDLMLDELRAKLLSTEFQTVLEKQIKTILHKSADGFFSKIFIWAGKTTGTLNFVTLTEVVSQQTAELLFDIKRNINHPLRCWLRAYGQKQLSAPDVVGQVELVARYFAVRWLNYLAESIEAGRLDGLMRGVLCKAAGLLQQDIEMVSMVRKVSGYIVSDILQNARDIIGNTIRHTLQRLNDKALSILIEDKVMEDLVWIRINGSVIGAGIGLVLFLVLRFIVDPYIGF